MDPAMNDDPLDRIPSFDRVSIRAVVVADGEDPGQALSQAGIFDPVAVAVAFGESPPDGSFGDGMTPNLTAVVAYDPAEGSDPGAGDREDGSRDRAANTGDRGAGVDPGTARPVDAGQSPAASFAGNLPPAYGLQPLAPVRPRGWAGGNSSKPS